MMSFRSKVNERCSGKKTIKLNNHLRFSVYIMGPRLVLRQTYESDNYVQLSSSNDDTNVSVIR